MWYLFCERAGAPNQMFQADDNKPLLDAKAKFEADGWTCTILDEAERQKYRHLTEQLIRDHPDLAV